MDEVRTTTVVSPGAITCVIGATYDAMERILAGLLVPAISRDDFIRVSRTMILKRLQNVYEGVTSIRPPHFIQMSLGITVPQPIGELLYALGPYRCTQLYGYYIFISSAQPVENIPDWRTFGQRNLTNYIVYCSRVKERYMQVAFPKQSHLHGRPLAICYKQEFNRLGRVKLFSDVVTPADVCLRFVHEEFYV